MAQPTDVREAAGTALQQVAGLRVHTTNPGTVATPAAIIELVRVGPFPGTLGNACDYGLKITLLVQLGDFRSQQLKIEELLDPVGTVSSSVIAALQSNTAFGQVTVEEPIGQPYEYAGDVYGGAVLLVEAHY